MKGGDNLGCTFSDGGDVFGQAGLLQLTANASQLTDKFGTTFAAIKEKGERRWEKS